MADISEQRVRSWRKSRLDAGASLVTVAKDYRLLKAVLNTPVDDGLIRRNPCRIKGAVQAKSPERKVLPIRDIGASGDQNLLPPTLCRRRIGAAYAADDQIVSDVRAPCLAGDHVP